MIIVSFFFIFENPSIYLYDEKKKKKRNIVIPIKSFLRNKQFMMKSFVIVNKVFEKL